LRNMKQERYVGDIELYNHRLYIFLQQCKKGVEVPQIEIKRNRIKMMKLSVGISLHTLLAVAGDGDGSDDNEIHW
jgi:hypothetical protein